ncbi:MULTISPECIES: hypothetical protein [unclassified Photorhabdus]|uniref:hypothetical protein n=1 Tax=unclassified Photorhabdus TaxID=2620880 RepID=UPI000DCEDE1F|nr:MULTISPECIES: hypothetical protein [unclassified Photorhabdus]RAW93238.1 hypothetical protein CKY03_22245 [Photorhabdus sp. S9-53]RAW93310.1 hypothetical protein CKY05_22180 [Photorhabdus sp. S10-54]RAW96797.1 hypothetical protein CKY04_22250 [Photorhabdus sp. S8-52]
MFYQTPYAADGYVDNQLTLMPGNNWMNSGDLFEKDSDNCYYWLSRAVNEFKVGGKFVPVQAISNQIIQELGYFRHYFSKGHNEVININIESSAGKDMSSNIRTLLSDSWHRYQFTVKVVSAIPTTKTGKIKSTSET